MPPEFQKIMDEILHNIPITFAFIDDIIIVTKGNKENHMTRRTLDEAAIRLKLVKCNFAQTSTNWLGFTLSENGIRPIEKNSSNHRRI